MPDHLHALFVLKDHLSVGQVVGKLKACSRPALLESRAKWQRDFFEHRLRPDDEANDFARYVFLNPYRAGLLARRAEWSYWLRKEDVDFDFLSMLDEGRFPPSEWLTLGTEQLGLQADRIGE
jgi:putative transposase